MIKPKSLRDNLSAQNPEFIRDPSKLSLYVKSGSPATRFTKDLGYQYSYQLVIEIRDFTGNSAEVFTPLMMWLRAHQPDMLQNHQMADKALTYEADLLDNGAIDIDITVSLTEAVTVEAQPDGGFKTTFRPDPKHDDQAMTDPKVLLASIFDDLGQMVPTSIIE